MDVVNISGNIVNVMLPQHILVLLLLSSILQCFLTLKLWKFIAVFHVYLFVSGTKTGLVF